MSQKPVNWTLKSLGDVSELKNGYAFKSARYKPYGKYKVVTIANVQEGRLSLDSYNSLDSLPSDLQAHQLLVPGDILVSMTGNVGRACIVKSYNLLLNQRVGKLVAKSVDSEYLFFVVHHAHFTREMEARAVGGAQGNVGKGAILSYSFHLPAERFEQRAIAEALSDADQLIKSLDRLIAKKRAIKQATMQQLLTGETRLPGFKGPWRTCRLGNALTFQVGFPFKSQYFNSEGRGIRLVRNGDLKGDEERVHYDGPYDASFEVHDGDVLIGMDGDFVPKMWRSGKALLNQRVGRINGSSALDVSFAFYRLTEPLAEIERATSGTTLKHLSHGDVASIEIPLPEIKEQKAIAQVLLDLEGEIAALERRRDKARQMKEGMMQELLTGRTRLVQPVSEAAESATV